MIPEQEVVARFMGMKLGFELGYNRWLHEWFDPKALVTGTRNERLLFAYDWNWLIPVMDKINSNMPGGYFKLHIHKSEYVNDRLSLSVSSDGSGLIENTFNTVVSVIKLINHLKENEQSNSL